MNKPKPYTVVVGCDCGCDDFETHHVTAEGPKEAYENVEASTKRPIFMVAIFEGHLNNLEHRWEKPDRSRAELRNLN